MSSPVVIYSKSVCKFCVMAKEFFKEHQIPYQEIMLDPKSNEYADQVSDLLERTNHTTFPYIFVGDEFIGGYTDLMTAYNTLRLHELLSKVGILLSVGDF